MPGNLLAAIVMGDIDAAESLHPLGNHHGWNLQALVSGKALLCGNRNGNDAVHFPLAQLGENIFFLLQAAVGVADNNAVSFIKCLVLD